MCMPAIWVVTTTSATIVAEASITVPLFCKTLDAVEAVADPDTSDTLCSENAAFARASESDLWTPVP